jgi:predicted ATPase/class 3 adenylate cyclase
VTCPSCGADNRAGSKFCSQCGAVMARTCATCGTALRPDAKFCDECGTPAGSQTPAPVARQPEKAPGQESGIAERRLVSVLFADLVGFTPLSENRDAEEVRELLTRYFDTCSALVRRYGGTVEKFIGDAVMAVWGAPVAHEDDAERAVRAALELVDAVAALGGEIGAPGLQARAGVLTGAAAVTMGAGDQGMVAGDLVNTASRVQAEAQPGTVLVGDATRQATEAALVYEDAGDRTLKGKVEPIRLWQALRVVAGRGGAGGGALQSEGLEPPFVGRDRELRLTKDLFHASAEQRKAHLVSVLGIAGIGKSRFSWEFFKYIDGLVERIYWHRGRCLAYGEGVTYWALAEMVRMRANIAEGEDIASARAKLQACLAEHLPDETERRWLEPRLAHLLALEEHGTQTREDLFSAWRLFFERLAARQPTILVFEDMQWADTSLIEFIEYLLEWSRSHALYVVTSARPELVDRHPTWGAGKRNFTSVFLEPLTATAMEQLLDGLVPGLPDELREQILQRAEGVPLYAVETVRMLLDRGLLTRAGNVYRLTGPVEDLEVPQSLQGLIAARLDGLRPEARRVLQDAAVLGKTFTAPSLASVSRTPEDELETLLAELVRKEVLSVQADPRSPERGQYGFLQDLVKRVAYETLSKRDRKEKHLTVAAWFEGSWVGEGSDLVEVVASHYLEAYNLAPQDPDADAVKERAANVLLQAGERAASLAANVEAEHFFKQAAHLVDSTLRQADVNERAGEMAQRAGRLDAAREHFERAINLYESESQAHPAARVLARLGQIESYSGHLDQAIQRMERAFAVLINDPPDADLATFAARLGTMHFFKGEPEAAVERNDIALDIAETMWLPEVLSQALNTKATIAMKARHVEEAQALLGHALRLALDNDIPTAALRAYNNLADNLCHKDRYLEALDLYRNGLALARRVGDRVLERSLSTEMAYVLMQTGAWDEAVDVATSVHEAELQEASGELLSLLSFGELYLQRGELAEFEKLVSGFAWMAESDDFQARAIYMSSRACWLRASGKHGEALAEARQAMTLVTELGGPGHQAAKAGFQEACEAAFEMGDLTSAEALLGFVDGMRPGERPPYLRAQAARFRARLAQAKGDDAKAESAFAEAEGIFTEISTPFRLAVTQLEHAEWLASAGRNVEAAPLLDEAIEMFVRLRAEPWIARARRSSPVDVVAS